MTKTPLPRDVLPPPQTLETLVVALVNVSPLSLRVCPSPRLLSLLSLASSQRDRRGREMRGVPLALVQKAASPSVIHRRSCHCAVAQPPCDLHRPSLAKVVNFFSGTHKSADVFIMLMCHVTTLKPPIFCAHLISHKLC